MDLICQTKVKRMSPKQGYVAPYVQFPWSYDESLIGKPITIYKNGNVFYISLDSESKPNALDASQKEQFTPSLNTSAESPNSDISRALVDAQNGECKPNENKKDPYSTEESLKGGRPGRNSNPSRLRDRQS